MYSFLVTNLLLLRVFSFTFKPVQRSIQYDPHDIKYHLFFMYLRKFVTAVIVIFIYINIALVIVSLLQLPIPMPLLHSLLPF